MSHLPRISKQLSPQASVINDTFQYLLADMANMDETERIRLCAAMTAQLAALTSKALGN